MHLKGRPDDRFSEGVELFVHARTECKRRDTLDVSDMGEGDLSSRLMAAGTFKAEVPTPCE